MSIATIANIFGHDTTQKIYWFTRQEIFENVINHYKLALNCSEMEFRQKIDDAYLKKGELKLLNGTKIKKDRYSNFYLWMQFVDANVNLILEELTPDITNIPESECKFPAGMQKERLGIYGKERFISIQEKYLLKVNIVNSIHG